METAVSGEYMKETFVKGLKDGLPICLGYFSVSIAFGMSAAVLGIPVSMSVLISASNLTSAGQIAGADLLASHATLIELALTTLIINARYFLMSLSLTQKVPEDMPLWQRLLVSYGITDEIFAVEIGQKGILRFAYIAGLILISALGWISGTAVGGLAGELLPLQVSASLNIALYAMFIAIIIPPSITQKNVLFCTGSAALLSLLFSILPGFREISSGYTIILVTIVISTVSSLKYPVSEENTDHE